MTARNENDSFEIFIWNKNFETGILEIDKQHKKLVELLNKLANSLTQDKITEIEYAFEELANYAQYHFKSEEAVWHKYLDNEELIKEHEKSHNSFLPKIEKIKKQYQNKPIYDMLEAIVLFLIKWLSFHIINEDKRLTLIIQNLHKGETLENAKFIVDNRMNGSMKTLIKAILTMYNSISIKTIKLIRERKARIKAEKQLKRINKKLERLSITDQLTNLYNRRHFEELFDLQIKKAKEEDLEVKVILFDIDYFKRLNDTYGHIKGDEALKAVSKCIKKTCKRKTDFAFRVGGEEFVILVIDEQEDSAINLAEKLKTNIQELEIPNINSEVSKYLTVSMGVVSLKISNKDTRDSIMKLADNKLYNAKELGRNIISF